MVGTRTFRHRGTAKTDAGKPSVRWKSQRLTRVRFVHQPLPIKDDPDNRTANAFVIQNVISARR
jgi:hypothetical protein